MVQIVAIVFFLILSNSIFAQVRFSNVPTDKRFTIQSAANIEHDSSKFLDIQNNSGFFKKKQSIQIWSYDEGRNQVFLFSKSPEEGYFEIYTCNANSSRLSVDSINTNENSKIEVKEKNDRSNQRFQFQHIGNGRFKIFDRYGRVFSLSCTSSTNGCIVNASKNNEGNSTEWFLIDFQSKSKFIPKDNNRSASQILNDAIIKLITAGKEADVKQYFQSISYEELINTDNGSIVKAFSNLNANDKVTHTIWILEEVKNRPLDIRRYVYSELGKVDYNKPTFLLKQLINNYFMNYTENEGSLLEKVATLQQNMNK